MVVGIVRGFLKYAKLMEERGDAMELAAVEVLDTVDCEWAEPLLEMEMEDRRDSE
jgi:hypothetical protein